MKRILLLAFLVCMNSFDMEIIAEFPETVRDIEQNIAAEGKYLPGASKCHLLREWLNRKDTFHFVRDHLSFIPFSELTAFKPGLE